MNESPASDGVEELPIRNIKPRPPNGRRAHNDPVEREFVTAAYDLLALHLALAVSGSWAVVVVRCWLIADSTHQSRRGEYHPSHAGNVRTSIDHVPGAEYVL